MRRPRIRIASVMVLTAIVALELGAMRLASDQSGPMSGMLAIGALPMANVRMLGLLAGWLHRASRSYLVGFVGLGALPLVFYVTAIRSPSDRESAPQTIVLG